MNKTLACTLLCLASLGAATAHAEGLTAGGSLGSARFKGDDLGGLSTDRAATGGKLYLGWGFSPYLGVEAGWADLGKFKSAAGDAKIDGAFLDLVGTFPIAPSWSALGRVGAFDGKFDSSITGSDRGTNLKVGLGLQYDVDKNLGVRGEWERYRVNTSPGHASTDLWSVGVNYKF